MNLLASVARAGELHGYLPSHSVRPLMLPLSNCFLEEVAGLATVGCNRPGKALSFGDRIEIAPVGNSATGREVDKPRADMVQVQLGSETRLWSKSIASLPLFTCIATMPLSEL